MPPLGGGIMYPHIYTGASTAVEVQFASQFSLLCMDYGSF